MITRLLAVVLVVMTLASPAIAAAPDCVDCAVLPVGDQEIVYEEVAPPSLPSFVMAQAPEESADLLEMTVTAYSSTEDQTDSSPYITAMGTVVEDGVVATNVLPFGTRVRLPDIFGDKIFIVEDRMNRRFRRRLDVWMPNREKAQNFGVRQALVEVLES